MDEWKFGLEEALYHPCQEIIQNILTYLDPDGICSLTKVNNNFFQFFLQHHKIIQDMIDSLLQNVNLSHPHFERIIRRIEIFKDKKIDIELLQMLCSAVSSLKTNFNLQEIYLHTVFNCINRLKFFWPFISLPMLPSIHPNGFRYGNHIYYGEDLTIYHFLIVHKNLESFKFLLNYCPPHTYQRLVMSNNSIQTLYKRNPCPEIYECFSSLTEKLPSLQKIPAKVRFYLRYYNLN